MRTREDTQRDKVVDLPLDERVAQRPGIDYGPGAGILKSIGKTPLVELPIL